MSSRSNLGPDADGKAKVDGKNASAVSADTESSHIVSNSTNGDKKMVDANGRAASEKLESPMDPTHPPPQNMNDRQSDAASVASAGSQSEEGAANRTRTTRTSSRNSRSNRDVQQNGDKRYQEEVSSPLTGGDGRVLLACRSIGKQILACLDDAIIQWGFVP